MYNVQGQTWFGSAKAHCGLRVRLTNQYESSLAGSRSIKDLDTCESGSPPSALAFRCQGGAYGA